MVELSAECKCWLGVILDSGMSIPAIQAVIKQAAEPAIIALNAMEAKSAFLSGAIDPSDPNWIPIEPKLEKPHNA